MADEHFSVVDCSLQEERTRWRYVDGLTQVKSALNGGKAWCLDGGESNWVHQTVTINAVSNSQVFMSSTHRSGEPEGSR